MANGDFSRVLHRRGVRISPPRPQTPDGWTKAGVIATAAATCCAAGALVFSAYQTDIMRRQLTIQDANTGFVSVMEKVDALCADDGVDAIIWREASRAYEAAKSPHGIQETRDKFAALIKAMRLLMISATNAQEEDLARLLHDVRSIAKTVSFPRTMPEKMRDRLRSEVTRLCFMTREGMIDWYKRDSPLTFPIDWKTRKPITLNP